MTRKIRWGVIGSGGIARRRTIPEGILPARNAQLVSVFDPVTSTNTAVADQFKARPVSSVEELLATDIDAVYVASPPSAHGAEVIACAQARKHVLCEKPLALSLSETEGLIEVCARCGVRLGTGFMMRFHAQHQAALEWIRKGKLGQPVFGRAQLSCWYPPMAGAWRQEPALGGGGSLMDMGGHCLDLLEMFFGPVRAVSCQVARTVHSYASEDSAVASLRFENGALGVVDTFFCMPDEASQNRLELYGSRGSILARGTIGQGASGEMVACSMEQGGYDAQQARGGEAGVGINPEPVNTYQAEIEEMSQAILDDREPLNNGALGLRCQRVLAACYESARSGRIIDVDPGQAADL